MNNKAYGISNIVLILISAILTGLNLFAYFELFNVKEGLKICLIVCCCLAFIIMLFLFMFKVFSLYRLIFICLALLSFFTWGYQLIVFLGYAEIFESVEAMQEFISKTGAWGIAVFMLIQFLQVVILPIPAMITTIAGAVLFGPTTAMILSIVSIIIASYVAFFMGRFFGEKVVSWIIGKEACDKYSKLLYDKGKYLFFLMMLFPFFPDDILCMVAGMTTMSLRFFTLTIFITRPIAIIPTCYLGGGTIIPYYGWGLIVWGILILIMATLFVLSYKYQSKIESFVTKLSQKFSKNSKNDTKISPLNKKMDEEIYNNKQTQLKDSLNKHNLENREEIKKEESTASFVPVDDDITENNLDTNNTAEDNQQKKQS